MNQLCGQSNAESQPLVAPQCPKKYRSSLTKRMDGKQIKTRKVTMVKIIQEAFKLKQISRATLPALPLQDSFQPPQNRARVRSLTSRAKQKRILNSIIYKDPQFLRPSILLNTNSNNISSRLQPSIKLQPPISTTKHSNFRQQFRKALSKKFHLLITRLLERRPLNFQPKIRRFLVMVKQRIRLIKIKRKQLIIFKNR